MISPNKTRRIVARLLLTAIVAASVVFVLNAKERYDELTEFKRRIGGLLIESSIACVIVDEKDVIEEWSPGATELLGWTDDDVVGNTTARLMTHRVDADTHTKAMKAIAAEPFSPRIILLNCEMRTKKGGNIDVIITIRNFGLKDGTTKWLATMHEVGTYTFIDRRKERTYD